MSYSTIKFEDNLIKNKACTITYSGILFQNNSEFVNIVYGFGNEWHHTKEQEMVRTEEGFVVEVNMLNYDTFNFCFRNSNYEWDNNNYQNYTSPITEEVFEENNFILNDDSVLTNIVNNLCEIDVSTADDTVVIENIETTESVEISENFDNIEVAETVNTIDSVEITENIESAETVTTSESESFEIEVETNTPVNIEDSLVNVTESETLDQDIENLFIDIYQEITSEEQLSTENNFNMNNLIDEILSPVVSSTIFDDEETNVNTISEETNSNDFFDDINDLEEDLNLDNRIDSLITNLFNNTRAFAENNKKFEENNINEFEITKAIDAKIEEILAETPIITEIIEETKTEEKAIEVSEVSQAVVKKKVPDFTIIEDEEESLIESLSTEESSSNNQTALVEVDTDNDFIVSPRALGKFYMFKKKVKLAFTKLFIAIPKLFTKGLDTENN